MASALQFSDAAIESQATFRAIMDAMARPGLAHRAFSPTHAPRALLPATAAIACALFDHETPVWLDHAVAAFGEVAAWLRFATGARIVSDPGVAVFALIGDPLEMPPFTAFPLGTDEYPDRSATLILEVGSLAAEDGVFVLSGPGLSAPRAFGAAPLPADFGERLAANRALFPRGVDLLFACGDAVAALPRSIHVASRGIQCTSR